MPDSSRRCSGFSLHHRRRRGVSRLVLLRDGVPVASSQPVATAALGAWMRRYDIPFTGLVRTGWVPTEDQWPAILLKWFPDHGELDPARQAADC
jgi:hypothetical protein